MKKIKVKLAGLILAGALAFGVVWSGVTPPPPQPLGLNLNGSEVCDPCSFGIVALNLDSVSSNGSFNLS